jgi:hypothetical protein
MSIREILKKSVGHGIEDRKRECDCLWCRKGGTFDQAISAIKSELLGKLPSIRELIEERLLLIDPRYGQQAYNKGFNEALSQIKKIIEEEG